MTVVPLIAPHTVPVPALSDKIDRLVHLGGHPDSCILKNLLTLHLML